MLEATRIPILQFKLEECRQRFGPRPRQRTPIFEGVPRKVCYTYTCKYHALPIPITISILHIILRSSTGSRSPTPLRYNETERSGDRADDQKILLGSRGTQTRYGEGHGDRWVCLCVWVWCKISYSVWRTCVWRTCVCCTVQVLVVILFEFYIVLVYSYFILDMPPLLIQCLDAIRSASSRLSLYKLDLLAVFKGMDTSGGMIN